MGSASIQIASGATIGPYVVERQLGHGGMSVLFLAHDTQLDRMVAIKMLSEDTSTVAMRARLLREARTLAAVDHPGIVRIYGAGEQEGRPWIAMELIRGTDLKRLLSDRGVVSPVRALRWTIQAADALAAAHDVGVIHRDVKPSNLLLSNEDQIKVVDFGIAKRRIESGSHDVLTGQGEVLGTPAYQSPEQLEHGLADERSDVWGLGCVLYELVAGTPPFGRGSATTTAAILRDEPSYPPTVPQPVVDVIAACLRKSSFSRVGSMRELAALARDVLENPSQVTSSAAASERISIGGVERSSRAVGRTSTRPPAPNDPPGGYASTQSSAFTSTHPSTHPPSMSQRPPTPARASVPPARGSVPPPAPRTSGPPPRGNMKGTAVRTGLLWFVRTHGMEAIERVHANASPEVQTLIRLDDPSFGVVASAWYQTRHVGELLQLIEREAMVDDADKHYDALAEAIAIDNVTGVYRSLFRLITTPSMLVANAQRVWRTYCDEGTLVAATPSRGELHLEIRGWSHHHPYACKVVGFAMQHVLRAIGYDGLVIERAQCVSSGDPWCAFDGMYLPK